MDWFWDFVIIEKNGVKGVEIDVVLWFNFVIFDMLGDLVFGELFDCLYILWYYFWIEFLINILKVGVFVVVVLFYFFFVLVFKYFILVLLKNKVFDYVWVVLEKVECWLNLEFIWFDIMFYVIN